MVTIPESLDGLRVPIGSVRPYERNPRRGDLAAIKESLEAHGQYRPIVVNRRTGEVLAGNHTREAAVELGWTEIAVTYVDVDDDQAARIVLVDNRTSDLSSYDDAMLADLLGSLPAADGTGWESRDLARLLAQIDRDLDADTDPVPVPADPRTRLGDVWVLGDHRLVCGDAANGAVAEAVAGRTVETLWTDPPYGVGYVGKTVDAMTITNDDEHVGGLLDAVLPNVDAVLADSGRFYIAAPAGPHGTAFRLAVSHAGWRLHEVLVWAKDVFVLGHSDYHYQHEDVLYGYKPGRGRAGRGNHAGSRWYGDNSASTVFQIPRPKRSTEHPTMKPVELIAQQLANSTRRGDLVLDPFLGSGSTLIACENLGRVCAAVDVDPGYCDVAVDRWERHTGREAVRG